MPVYKQEIPKEKEEKLLEISKKTLKLVEDKLNKQRNKVLVVRPTGFGKSYMLAGLTTTKNPDGTLKFKKCLYIYPTDVIKEDVIRTYASESKFNASVKQYNWENNTRKSDERAGMLNDNTDFYSYKYLTNRANDIANGDMKKKDFRSFIKQYDLIMLDECHRVGADGFQEAFSIFESCIGDDTCLVGVTATPDRYDEESIRKVFGEKNDIEPYTMNDAIRNGLLQKFDYIYVASNSDKFLNSCVDTLNKLRESHGDMGLQYHEIQEIKQTIKENGLSRALKENLKLPLADGEVEPHVGKSNYAKFVIFMNNRKHIHESAEWITNQFKEVYPTMEIKPSIIITKTRDDSPYIINGKTYEVIDTTELSNLEMVDNTIDLIFCVDKLNMGYHVESITGVILCGDTESAVKYNQQIGRCFSVRSMNKPIIIDIVNEFDRSPSLSEVDKSFKGRKVALPAKLSSRYVDSHDYTKYICEHAEKITTMEYSNYDIIEWLYTARKMKASDISKTLNTKLDTVLKCLMSRGVQLADIDDIKQYTNLLSESIRKEVIS